MPEHIRALIVVLPLALGVFAFARSPACDAAMTKVDFARRRNLWIAITCTLFLAHSFWVYIVVVAILLAFCAPREPNKLALYYFVLFAAPMIQAEITGFGIIRHFFAIDYARLLALAILLPAYIALSNRADTERFGRSLPDKLLAGYLVLQFVLMLKVSTFTNTLRIGAFYSLIDVFLPYYVASRSLRDLRAFRDAAMGLAVGALVLAAISCFEFTKHWLLYSTLDVVLGEPWGYGRYLGRGEALRALATAGQPIALGFVMMVALIIFPYLKKSVSSTARWRLGMLLLAGGMIGAMSRGPWTGTAAASLVFIALGPHPLRGFSKVALCAVLLVPLLLATSAGDKIIDMLPFVGTVDDLNVLYRQRLLEIALEVISQNPYFGAFDFIYSPAFQELKQGDGIIDVVNTYVGIGLSSGLVGLSLFIAFFVVVCVRTYKAMRSTADKESERYLLGRTLLAAMAGIHVTIFTVSSITIIPLLYWSLAGMAVAYAGLVVPAPTPAKAGAGIGFPAAVAQAGA